MVASAYDGESKARQDAEDAATAARQATENAKTKADEAAESFKVAKRTIESMVVQIESSPSAIGPATSGARTQMLKQAAEFYGELIRLRPEDSEAYGRRAKIRLWLTYERELGRADLKKALELEPENPEWYEEASFLDYVEGRLDSALAHARRAVELAPNRLSARGRLSTVEAKQRWMRLEEDRRNRPVEAQRRPHPVEALRPKSFEVAKAALERAAEQEKGMRSLQALAILCLREGDQVAYREACQRALARHPASEGTDHWMDRRTAAWMAAVGPAAVDDYQPVVEFARSLVKGVPTELGCRKALGAVLYRAGQYEEAGEWLRPIAHARFRSASLQYETTHLLLAMTEAKLGHRVQAAGARPRGGYE
jgi:tetratricopeptide (TPR) repeat protein